MGAFYGSIQVRTDDRDSVVAAADAVARGRGIRCLVAQESRGWVAVFLEGNGQDQRVGAEIAKKVKGFVLQLLLHDDDVMAYWLWRDGEEIDGYFSRPGFLGYNSPFVPWFLRFGEVQVPVERVG